MDETPPQPDVFLNVADTSPLCSAAMQTQGEPAADVAVEPPETSAEEVRALAAPRNSHFAPIKVNKVSPKKRARPRGSVGCRKTKTQAGRKASRLSDLVRRAAEESDEAAEKEVAPPRSRQVTRSIEGAEATIYFPRVCSCSPAVMMMHTWLSNQWRRDPFEAVLSAGALLLNAMGIVLVGVMFATEVGILPKQVEWLAQAVWWGGAAILAAILAYYYLCRPPRPPLGTSGGQNFNYPDNSNDIPQAVAAAVAEAQRRRAERNLADEEQLNELNAPLQSN
eukprot:s825_g6.t1